MHIKWIISSSAQIQMFNFEDQYITATGEFIQGP